MAKIAVVCPRGTDGHSTSDAQLYRCGRSLKTFQLSFQYNAAKPNTHQSIIRMTISSSGCRDTVRVLDISLNTPPPSKKLGPRQQAQHVELGAEVVICCKADEQWSFIRCKGNPR